jgi:RAB protein geranylgeranyltransferase component A
MLMDGNWELRIKKQFVARLGQEQTCATPEQSAYDFFFFFFDKKEKEKIATTLMMATIKVCKYWTWLWYQVKVVEWLSERKWNNEK